MPKITIDLPLEVNKKLKEKAKADYRSLANYITVALINLANNDNANIINLSSLPEGTTIKTKTAHVLTPEEERTNRYNHFQTLAKQILGHTLDNADDYRVLDYNRDSSYYNTELEEPIREGSSVKCVYIYNLPEEKQIEYLKDFKHYEDEDRGLTRPQSFFVHIYTHTHRPGGTSRPRSLLILYPSSLPPSASQPEDYVSYYVPKSLHILNFLLHYYFYSSPNDELHSPGGPHAPLPVPT